MNCCSSILNMRKKDHCTNVAYLLSHKQSETHIYKKSGLNDWNINYQFCLILTQFNRISLHNMNSLSNCWIDFHYICTFWRHSWCPEGESCCLCWSPDPSSSDTRGYKFPYALWNISTSNKLAHFNHFYWAQVIMTPISNPLTCTLAPPWGWYLWFWVNVLNILHSHVMLRSNPRCSPDFDWFPSSGQNRSNRVL